MERYGGELPRSYEALLTLPGIGPYTAGAVASIAYGIPVPAVDGNVLRVATRLTADPSNVSEVYYIIVDEGAKNKKIIQPSAAFCRFFPRRGSQLHEPLLASAEFQIQQRAGDEQRRAADSEIGGHADNVAQEEDIEQRRRDEYAPGGEKTDADAQAVLHHVDLVNVVELREAQVYHHAVERDEHRDDGPVRATKTLYFYYL